MDSIMADRQSQAHLSVMLRLGVEIKEQTCSLWQV